VMMWTTIIVRNISLSLEYTYNILIKHILYITQKNTLKSRQYVTMILNNDAAK
jgi:hypothetical protein